MNLTLIHFIITGLTGLCLGSFIHVVICRFSPQKTTWQFLVDISFKRSSCANCNTKLSLLSLIPVMSWLIQRGKCNYCLAPIAVNYLLTELAIAIYCVVMVAIYGISYCSIMLILLGLTFTVLAIIDIKYFLLPNCFNYFILLFGLIMAYFQLSQVAFVDALLGMIIGYMLLYLPATLYYLLKKQVGLGGGDIKLLAALGTWINYAQLPILLIMASLLGLIYFVVIYCLKIDNRPNPTKTTWAKTAIIPFGPCLLISAYGLLLFDTL